MSTLYRVLQDKGAPLTLHDSNILLNIICRDLDSTRRNAGPSEAVKKAAALLDCAVVVIKHMVRKHQYRVIAQRPYRFVMGIAVIHVAGRLLDGTGRGRVCVYDPNCSARGAIGRGAHLPRSLSRWVGWTSYDTGTAVMCCVVSLTYVVHTFACAASGGEPRLRTYAPLLSGYAAAADAASTRSLYNAMLARNIRPSQVRGVKSRYPGHHTSVQCVRRRSSLHC